MPGTTWRIRETTLIVGGLHPVSGEGFAGARAQPPPSRTRKGGARPASGAKSHPRRPRRPRGPEHETTWAMPSGVNATSASGRSGSWPTGLGVAASHLLGKVESARKATGGLDERTRPNSGRGPTARRRRSDSLRGRRRAKVGRQAKEPARRRANALRDRHRRTELRLQPKRRSPLSCRGRGPGSAVPERKEAPMTSAITDKRSTEQKVLAALVAVEEATVDQVAAEAAIGRTSARKYLAALEQTGAAKRAQAVGRGDASSPTAIRWRERGETRRRRPPPSGTARPTAGARRRSACNRAGSTRWSLATCASTATRRHSAPVPWQRGSVAHRARWATASPGWPTPTTERWSWSMRSRADTR